MRRTHRLSHAIGIATLTALIAPVARAASAKLELVPDLHQWLILLAGFVLLIPIVTRLIVRPVYAVIDERAERIAGARARAEALETNATEVLARYEAGLRAVREENDRNRSEHVGAARAEQKEMTASAREEADREIERSLSELTASLESARSGLRTTAEELAREAAERILGRPLA